VEHGVKQAKKRGVNVELVTYNDHAQPDAALEHGDERQLVPAH
jgi:ABC-type metal ion transport system substrate-binding protein